VPQYPLATYQPAGGVPDAVTRPRRDPHARNGILNSDSSFRSAALDQTHQNLQLVPEGRGGRRRLCTGHEGS